MTHDSGNKHTMASQHDFIIGGHLVRIIFSEQQPQPNDIALLPSFGPFATDEAGTERPLLTLTVDDTLRPAKQKTLVRNFDTGNGDTIVHQLPDGGYQFIVKDTAGRPCCLLIANADFSSCRCALNGTPQMRSFGLNDALMLAYAFAGNHFDTLLIHASCATWGGRAYPFTAKSGTGKSTHTSLWLTHIPGAQLLNDDNPIIRIEQGTAYVYGSPWSGKTPCYRNRRLPLGALTRIERAPANSIERLRPVEAFASLLPTCSSMKWDEATYRRLCDTLTRIIQTIPIYTLHCLPDREAATLCHTTLTQHSA